MHRRLNFARSQMYLPLVLRAKGNEARSLRYEEDILSAIDWHRIDVTPLAAKIPENTTTTVKHMQRIVTEAAGASQERIVFEAVYAVRMISDIVPNAWWVRDIVGDLLAALGRVSGFVFEELRK